MLHNFKKLHPASGHGRYFLLAIIPVLLAAGPMVTVHKIDDSVVTGELTSVADGKITVKPSATQPAAEIAIADVMTISTSSTPNPSAAAPTTAPASVSATTQSADDQIEANGPPVPANMPAGRAVRVTRQRGVVGALVGAFGGGNSSDDEEPAPAPAPAPVAPRPAPAITSGHLLDGTFGLADGDRIHAGVTAWDDKTAKLQIVDVTAPVSVPASEICSFWIADTTEVAKAKALAVDPGPEDIAFVKKDSGVIAVKGLVQGVGADGVVFRYDDKDRKIDRAKIVGLLVRSNPAKPDPAFHQTFRTVNADLISGTWSGMTGDSAVIHTSFGTDIKLPMKSVISVSGVNGRVVYVSDLKPSTVEQTPYFGRMIPYKLDQNLDGGPMVLSDGPHARGIAVHSRCVLTYDLNGYERFKTDLGFEQPGGKSGRVAVRVLGDDKVLFEQADLRGDQPSVLVDVDVAGVKKLVLEVDFGADQDTGDRVDWADARLTRAAK